MIYDLTKSSATYAHQINACIVLSHHQQTRPFFTNLASQTAPSLLTRQLKLPLLLMQITSKRQDHLSQSQCI